MPRISEFYGIVIYMYYDDHNPPHFHAFYRDTEAAISISTGEILAGDIARRAHKLLIEWAEIRHNELSDNWQRATNGESLLPVDPLD